MSKALKIPKRPLTPVSIRFTDDEKSYLLEKAAGQPLSVFIRLLVLDRNVLQARIKRPIKDGEALGQVLALLGQSRIANNLNQLAKAVHLGALPVTQEVETDLRDACAEIHEMRRLLLSALGIVIMDQALPTRSVSEVFAKNADGGQP